MELAVEDSGKLCDRVSRPVHSAEVEIGAELHGLARKVRHFDRILALGHVAPREKREFLELFDGRDNVFLRLRVVPRIGLRLVGLFRTPTDDTSHSGELFVVDRSFASTNLIQQVNQLKAELSSTQKELDKSNKANSSWQKTNDSLKTERQDALDELEKQRQEVSRLMALTMTQDERLQSITLKVNDTLQQINAENSSWGRFGVDGKKLAIALEALRWVTSETSNPR